MRAYWAARTRLLKVSDGHGNEILVIKDQRPWFFLLFWIASLAVYWRPLKALSDLSFQDERYSYLLSIPLISAFLIYLDRRRIFSEPRFSPVSGGVLATVALILCLVAPKNGSYADLALSTLSLVLAWVALFVGFYGGKSARVAGFSLCFLALMIPLPALFLDAAVVALQRGSADLAYFLFKVLRVPVLRQGFVFSLPGIDIEIARECSGIRSSTALLISGVLVAQLFLQSAWHKLWFGLFVIPVAVFKNAVRIVTLSYLGVYVDKSFLLGSLHHRGGFLFAFLGVATLLPILLVLRKIEDRRGEMRRL